MGMKALFPLILILIPCFNCEEKTVLPQGNYFNGNYLKNIGGVAKLIASIVKNEEKFPLLQRSLFLSQTSLTATEIPSEPEGSGQKPEVKAYIPLTEFRRLASNYLDRVAKHQTAVEAKTDLKERLRDLRTENLHRKYAMDKYFNDLEENDVVKQYQKFLEEMIEVQKKVLDFFTLKSENIPSSLFSELQTTPQEMLQKIVAFAGENNIMDLLLTKNKYTDKVFMTMYQTFRNHAIFLTVAWTANEIAVERGILGDSERFENHEKAVFEGYSTVLNALKSANERRETNGFKFNELFTASQLSLITGTSNLPNPGSQNLFVFKEESESFEPKYAYITLRLCKEKGSVYERLFSDSYTSMSEPVDGCEFMVIRRSFSNAPAQNVKNNGYKLRNAAISAFESRYNFDTTDTAGYVRDKMGSWNDIGLFALFVQRRAGIVTDNVYHDEHTYKVVVDVAAVHEYEEYVRYQGHVTRQTNINIQVIGYFIKPKAM